MGCGAGKIKSQSQTFRISTVAEIRVQPAVFVVENENRFQEVYKLGKKLGSGAFGDVRLCFHMISNIERAVKIFRKDLATDEDKKKQLMNEIDILKSLDHPNIVRVYEFFEDKMRFYIVMEHCRGGELFTEITKRSSFSESHAAQIARQLLSAIAYLHEHNIVHRDLKPENILLEETGDISNLKLIDFGASAYFQKNHQMKTILGTAYYISPEVLNGNYTEKCDLWSCGVIVFILLSGHPPFDGRNDTEIIEHVQKGKFKFRGESWKAISKDAKDFISSLLCSASTRLSAFQALLHPWISNNASRNTPSTEIIHSAITSLQQFHKSSKLRDAINTFITTQCISQKDTKDLREVFYAMDTNKDGKLSREELLNQFTKTMGAEAADEEVDRIMREVDTDSNGYIDYTEFLKATIDTKTLMSVENMKHAFDAFDKDGSQSISAQELKRMLEGNATSENEVWRMIIEEVDKNGDGEIDYNEFQAIIFNHL